MLSFTPRQKESKNGDQYPVLVDETDAPSTDEIANAIQSAISYGRRFETEMAQAGMLGDYGYCEGTGGIGPGRYPSNANYPTGGPGPGLELFSPAISFPNTTRGKLHRVDYWTEQDELLERLLRVKQEFTVMGLTFRPKKNTVLSSGKKPATAGSEADPLPAEMVEFALYLERMFKKWDWQKIVEDLLSDWFSKDTMILYWKLASPNELSGEMEAETPEERSKEELTPGLEEVCALNPSECDWKNSFGQDNLRYYIPAVIKQQIQDALSKSGDVRTELLTALIESGVQVKYIMAVMKNRDYVDLREEDGDNWLIFTRARKRHGIARPSMAAIFLPLEMRKFITEGEFSASILMKFLMLHATRGESITQGPLAGQRLNWAKKTDITKLHAVIKDPSKATRVVTDHTVKFNFVYPPKDIWSQEKFLTCDSRIYNWAGVTIVMMTGQGGTNSGGYIGIKRMISSMSNARSKIALMIYEFFDKPEVRTICKISDDVDIKAVFDENVLKEPRQLLDELKFLVGEGIGDPRITLSELGRDPDTVRDSKRQSLLENTQSPGLWEPVYRKQVSFGDQTGKQQSSQGRPPNTGTQVDEETRTQSTKVS